MSASPEIPPILRFNPHPASAAPPLGNKDYSKTRHKRTVKLRQVQQKFQGAMLTAVSLNDIRKIMIALVLEAKRGNISAAREVLDRCVGKTAESDLIARLEDLEAMILSGQATIKEGQDM